ncbi:MAG: hypothetical protein KAT15_11380 [Bacteroidales bacterium]|nr:hypothetical protein [Bacteroidales bacterium]
MVKQHDIQEGVPGMDNKNPFRVPANYFEELPMRIQERLDEDRAGIKMIDMLRTRLAYAAMIAVMITAGFLGMRYLSSNNILNSLSADEIVNAIEYYGYEFEDDMLISALVESDVEYFPVFPNAETDQIIEYLADDYIDFSEFMNK